MATISENLQIIADSTTAIKQAIIAKGGEITGNITTWADVISGLSGGSGEIQPTANLITNKLNGATIGDPNIYYDLETLLYTYQFISSTDLYVKDVVLIPEGCFYQLFLSSNWPYSDFRFGDLLIETKFKGIVKDDYTIIDGTYRWKCKTLELSICHVGDSLGEKSNLNYIVIAFGSDGSFDFDKFVLNISEAQCYIKDTNISLSNGMIKPVQDVTYDDVLLVWNFDEGKFDTAKPLWIKKEEITNNYYKVTLDNGNTIGLVGSNGRCHRLFDYDNMIFESATALVGKDVHTLNGVHKVISVENIKENVSYYNIITDFHMNCFANGMLTSCRYNNIYPIKNMIFDKSNISLESKWKVHQEKFKQNPEISPKYIRGMRLDENTVVSTDEMKDYITNLENKRKTIFDFNSEGILNNIEDTEVGWVDRNGKAYGFKLYMHGQRSHIALANKICKELNIETENPSRYLEKEGWLKYTTDFVLNSNDTEINDKQLNTLKRFLNTPNKLKIDGKIRIGHYRSPHVNVSEFDNMDKCSFEYRKQRNLRN